MTKEHTAPYGAGNKEEMRKMEKQRGLWRRMTALLLSLVMTAGMLLWNTLDVRADDWDWEWEDYDGTTGKFRLKRMSDGKDQDWSFPVLMETGQKVCVSDYALGGGISQTHYTICYYLQDTELGTDAVTASGGGAFITIGRLPVCAGYTKWNMQPVYSENKVNTWKLEAVVETPSAEGGAVL